jgi:hypothetical protein
MFDSVSVGATSRLYALHGFVFRVRNSHIVTSAVEEAGMQYNTPTVYFRICEWSCIVACLEREPCS